MPQAATINVLADEISRMKDNDEHMDEASWGMEAGVILTGNQVQELLADIEIGDMRLDEAHKALEAVYESSINLGELTSVVRSALGLQIIKGQGK